MNTVIKAVNFDSLPNTVEALVQKMTRDMIGVENVFDKLLSHTWVNPSNYPPFNIEKVNDSKYVVTIAVAGFGKKDIEVSVENNTLSVSGHKENIASDKYLHRGISSRDFKLSWNLSNDVEVKNAEVKDGLLSITLEREVLEENKPRLITIK